MLGAAWFGPRDVRVVEKPVPEPGPGEVSVEIDLAYICASDIAEFRDGPHVIPTSRPHPLTGKVAPVVLGHEYVGRVVAAGDGVDASLVGRRVCGDACIRCGVCFWCVRGEYNICASGGSVGLHADGAFAPVAVVPSYTVFEVPDSVPDELAAMVEPLAVGLHALRRARFTAGESVVVLGFGMVGAATAAVARATGAGRVLVVESVPARAALAAQMGFRVVAADDSARRTVRAETTHGADVVADCTGSASALAAAVELSRRGGRVVVCGLAHTPSELRADRIVYFEREVIGSLGYRFDHTAVIELLHERRFDLAGVAGDPIALRDIVPAGFERALSDPGAPLRIPVVPREA